MPSPIEAVFFDLYGTLARIRSPAIHKQIPRRLKVGARPWIELVRGELMTRRFGDVPGFVRFICDSLAPNRSADDERECRAIVEGELESIELFDGVRTLLGFLKRRGFRLGLISNLASVHAEPIERLGLAEYFDAVGLSCDVGMLKPDPRIYLDLCSRIGVEPRAVMFVGDSRRNDVLGPRALGMRAIQIGSEAGLESIADLGWHELDEVPSPLMSGETEIALDGRPGRLEQQVPLADGEQGRFNLVARAVFRPADESGPQDVFCKRFRFPEAAHVEEFAHRLMKRIGIPACDVHVHPGAEPVLVVSKAPGRLFEGPVDEPLAYEIGRHCAAAYLSANADLRPRNAFVSRAGGHPLVTMVDLEHCLFNLALDVTGLEKLMRPQTFDRLSREEFQRRIKRRVLTERTTRRAQGTFLEFTDLESPLARVLRDGWIDTFRRAQAEHEAVCGSIRERVYTEPYLIIGTKAYRRAMSGYDVDDMRERMRQDPVELFPRLAALKRRRREREA